MLLLLLLLYSDVNEISVHNSRPSFVLPTHSTDYYSKILANIPKKGISKLDVSLLDNTTTLHGQVTRELTAQVFYMNIYLLCPQKVIQPIYACRLQHN